MEMKWKEKNQAGSASQLTSGSSKISKLQKGVNIYYIYCVYM